MAWSPAKAQQNAFLFTLGRELDEGPATGWAAAGSSGHSGHAPKLMKNAQHFPLLNTLHEIQKITVYLGKSRARGDRLDRLHVN